MSQDVGSSNISQQEMLTHQRVEETDPNVSSDLSRVANEDGNRLALDVPALTENNVISISQELSYTSIEITIKAKTQDKVYDLMCKAFPREN